ncbi:unnamed protein product [Absidia cylindrospora]
MLEDPLPLDNIINAEVTKLLKTYHQLNDKDDLLFLRLLLSRIVTSMTPRFKALFGNCTFGGSSTTGRCVEASYTFQRFVLNKQRWEPLLYYLWCMQAG